MFQPNLRPQVTELVSSARQLYEETCNLLREKAQSLVSTSGATVHCSTRLRVLHILHRQLYLVTIYFYTVLCIFLKQKMIIVL